MTRSTHTGSHAALALLVLIFWRPAAAQDAPTANPATVRVTFENDRVRILESALPPGAKEKIHSHPACVVHFIEGGKARNHAPDGTTTDSEIKAGVTVYRDPVTHWTENIGTTTIRLVLVELKGPA